MTPDNSPQGARSAEVARALQDSITAALERLDGASFIEESWERDGGGGGRSRVLQGGGVFEKAGVNFSEVYGELSTEFAPSLPGEGRKFFATGVSLVLHPRSPRVPTCHANFRYIEKGEAWWFGGGADLTPYRLYEEDARHFHRMWREACDRHDSSYYPRFKKWCDEYFFLPHRGEARGVGGIFFDNLGGDFAELLAFWTDAGHAFLPAYLPIVERRRDERYEEAERQFQLERRGRYVEFNLLYDRGTSFGLKTGGRVESILMSMPPLVSWMPSCGPNADAQSPSPSVAGAEALLDVLRQPRDWLADDRDDIADSV